MSSPASPAVLRAYVVDDEPLAVRRLVRLLKASGRVEVAGGATDSSDALNFLSTNKVDVLFLDIQMPGMNGFELLTRLAAQPFVVFTTAYDQYALKAFEVNSIDYLLKPIEPQQLERALNKLQRLTAGAAPEMLARPEWRAVLEELARAVRAPGPEYPDRIPSRLGDRVQLIEVARVTHFFAQDKLTYAAAGGHNYCIDHTITDLEHKLDPRKFLRIHRATLLNVDWVQEVESWFSGGAMVRLKDAGHTELQVARDRVRSLKDRLGL